MQNSGVQTVGCCAAIGSDSCICGTRRYTCGVGACWSSSNVACTCTAAAAATDGGGGEGHDCALLPDGPAGSGWQHVVGSARGFIGQLGPEHSTAVFSTATRAMRVAVASGFGVGRCASGEAAGGPQNPRQGGSRRSGPRFELIAILWYWVAGVVEQVFDIRNRRSKSVASL